MLHMTDAAMGGNGILSKVKVRATRNLLVCESTAGIPGALARNGW